MAMEAEIVTMEREKQKLEVMRSRTDAAQDNRRLRSNIRASSGVERD